jgi:hypothetical protein
MTVVDATVRTCSLCGHTKSVDGFAGSADECLRCAGLHTRHRIDSGPDHRIAVRLRCELAHDRRYGVPFDVCWAAHVELAVRGLKYRERVEWQAAFEATKHAWRAAYERQGVSGGLTIELLDDGTI